jgi:hypothetical protein
LSRLMRRIHGSIMFIMWSMQSRCETTKLLPAWQTWKHHVHPTMSVIYQLNGFCDLSANADGCSESMPTLFRNKTASTLLLGVSNQWFRIRWFTAPQTRAIDTTQIVFTLNRNNTSLVSYIIWKWYNFFVCYDFHNRKVLTANGHWLLYVDWTLTMWCFI